jgi:predicted secreted protein
MGKIGRQDVFTWNGSAIAGVRSKGLSHAGEPIDISSDSSAGWRELLTLPGENQVTLTISGVVRDRRLIEDWYAGNRTRAVAFTFANSGGTLSGNFFLSSLSETGEYNGAATFDAELQSTGAITYAASAAPVNSVLPSIAGLPQVGVTLTANPGVWSGNPSFTYQWQRATTNIAGATNATYVPVVGDVSNAIRVVVTAINTAGSANATSAPSATTIS